jgi:hypothetical protein
MRHVIRSVLKSLLLTMALIAGPAGNALAVPNQLAPDPFQLGEPAPLAYRLLGQGGALAFHQQLQPCMAHDPALCLVAPALELEELFLSSSWLLVSMQTPQPPAITPSTKSMAPPSVVPPAVGGELSLGNGRELSLQITPTPRRCAPLVKLTF